MQIVQSPFNSNRQCMLKPYNDYALTPVGFVNYKNIDDYFTLHFQFRYDKSPRWIEGWDIYFTLQDGSTSRTAIRLREGAEFSGLGWFNNQSMGIYLSSETNYDCACILKDGVLQPYINGVHYNNYYVGNIKRVDSVYLNTFNAPGRYNHYSDLYFDDIFCCFGKALIEDGYTPDYENYFMLDKFGQYKIYEQEKNQYAY